MPQSLYKGFGFAGTGRAHHIKYKNPFFRKHSTILLCNGVINSQHLADNLYSPGAGFFTAAGSTDFGMGMGRLLEGFVVAVSFSLYKVINTLSILFATSQ